VGQQPGGGAVLVSVNVGQVRHVEHHDRDVTTGIFKAPVEGPVATHGVNLDGDDQADRRAHGGPDRAAYAYASEDLAWWSEQLARPLPPGSMGENLTTAGVDVTGARIGERWRIGTVLFEVSSPRVPCFKLGIRMEDARFQQRFAAAGRPGAYLRIVQQGSVEAGDPITVVHRPDHAVTVALVSEVYHDDRARALELLAAPELTDGWREWALAQDVTRS
jgi:MOSC domain-containing protein YiiM